MSYERNDKRAHDKIRNTKITPNISPYAEGSALIEVGGTKVICTASVEDRVPMFMRNKGLGWVTA
jgi:ribonuclease PH